MQNLVVLLCFLWSLSAALRLEERNPPQVSSAATEPEMQTADSLIELEKFLLHHQSQKKVAKAQARIKTSETRQETLIESRGIFDVFKSDCSEEMCNKMKTCKECQNEAHRCDTGDCYWCPREQGKRHGESCRSNGVISGNQDEHCPSKWNGGKATHGEEGYRMCDIVEPNDDWTATYQVGNKLQTRSTTQTRKRFEGLKDNPNTKDMYTWEEWQKLSIPEQQEVSSGTEFTDTSRESWNIKDFAMDNCGSWEANKQYKQQSGEFCCINDDGNPVVGTCR